MGRVGMSMATLVRDGLVGAVAKARKRTGKKTHEVKCDLAALVERFIDPVDPPEIVSDDVEREGSLRVPAGRAVRRKITRGEHVRWDGQEKRFHDSVRRERRRL
jgi:hypothetical protein